MADKTLTHGQKGVFEDLIKDAIDPSDIEDKPTDSRFGLPKFLSWTLKKDETGDYWEAIGKDNKIYRIRDARPIVERQYIGKVEIL